jgi:hypothetical protein
VDRIRELSNANDWIAFSQQNNRITFLWTSWWSFFCQRTIFRSWHGSLNGRLGKKELSVEELAAKCGPEVTFFFF